MKNISSLFNFKYKYVYIYIYIYILPLSKKGIGDIIILLTSNLYKEANENLEKTVITKIKTKKVQ